MRHLSTPVQRENVALKLDCADLMLDMFELHVEEERERRLEDLRKGYVRRTLEEYIKEEPNYTKEEAEWVRHTQ